MINNKYFLKPIFLFVIIFTFIFPLSSHAKVVASTTSTTISHKGNNLERQKESAIKNIDKEIKKLTKNKKNKENPKHVESLKETKAKISSAKDVKEIQKLIKKARGDGREVRKVKNSDKKAEAVKVKTENPQN